MARKIEYFLATNLKGCRPLPLFPCPTGKKRDRSPPRCLCTSSLRYRISISMALYAYREAAHASLLALYQYRARCEGRRKGMHEDRSFNFFSLASESGHAAGDQEVGTFWKREGHVLDFLTKFDFVVWIFHRIILLFRGFIWKISRVRGEYLSIRTCL